MPCTTYLPLLFIPVQVTNRALQRYFPEYVSTVLILVCCTIELRKALASNEVLSGMRDVEPEEVL